MYILSSHVAGSGTGRESYVGRRVSKAGALRRMTYSLDSSVSELVDLCHSLSVYESHRDIHRIMLSSEGKVSSRADCPNPISLGTLSHIVPLSSLDLRRRGGIVSHLGGWVG